MTENDIAFATEGCQQSVRAAHLDSTQLSGVALLYQVNANDTEAVRTTPYRVESIEHLEEVDFSRVDVFA